MPGATSRAFQVKIVGDVNDAKRSLQSLDKRAGAFTKAMKVAGVAMAAAFAVKKVFDFGASAVKRAEEMASAYAITEKIVEQTGGAANITADQVKALNRELSLRTGIDKALITTGSNVLLTFKGIKNEVGEGNDIFTRASEVMLDMSAVFGGDAKQAATQLGKALEDPIKGIGALARVGVTFTDQQKEQIRTLVESGNTIEAQRIILAALEGQVGGTAEASADSTAKIKNAWKEVQEWIGTKLLPILDKLAAWIWDTVIPAVSDLSAWIKENVPPWYEEYIKPTLDAIREIIGDVVAWMSAFWAEHGDKIVADIKKTVGLIIGYYTSVYNLIKTVLEPVISWLADMWEQHGDKITATVMAWWDTVSLVVGYVWTAIQDLVALVTAIFNGDWSAAWELAKAMGQKFLDFMAAFPGKVLSYMGSLVTTVGTLALDIGKSLVDGIVTGIGGMVDAVTSGAQSAAKAMINAFIGAWNRLDPRITLPTMTIFGRRFGGQRSPDLLPDLPYLAEGGIATSATLAMIGEGKYPEAVIPLKPGMGFGGGNNYTIHVTIAPGGDLAEAGREMVDAIVAHERNAGQGWRTQAAL